MLDRRQFLRASGGSAGAFAVGATCPGLWDNVARSATNEADTSATKLVVIELTGGNDGLNTVIPIDHDVYRSGRPTLAVKRQDAIMLSDSMAFHPSLKPLMNLWENEQLAIVQNVGYPNPSRSHFRSMDVWQSARVNPEPLDGWLGRLSDDHNSCQSLYVGNSALPLALRRGNGGASPSIGSFEEYQLRSGATLATPVVGDGRSADRESRARDLLANISQRTELAAKMAATAQQLEPTRADSSFEARLMTVYRMMKVDPTTRVFYTARDGFDTHVRQNFAHASLLQDVANSLRRFTRALQQDGLFEQVLILVYSEFGRRIKENGTYGTDHGAAAPLLAIGGGVVGGLHGSAPDFTDLWDGDLRYQVDFRDVYATALNQWLNVDSESVLGQRETSLAYLG